MTGTHPPAPEVFQALHRSAAGLGTRLFTITTVDMAAGLARRAHTSHPREYPVQGTKPMLRDAWFLHCVEGRKVFVANTPEEFREHFFDHALIESLGLGSACNIPVAGDVGPVLATVNLLSEAGHFTPGRLAAYEDLVAVHRAAIVAALA